MRDRKAPETNIEYYTFYKRNKCHESYCVKSACGSYAQSGLIVCKTDLT
jgi:hypothetical protein